MKRNPHPNPSPKGRGAPDREESVFPPLLAGRADLRDDAESLPSPLGRGAGGDGSFPPDDTHLGPPPGPAAESTEGPDEKVHYRGGMRFCRLLELARELRQRQTPSEQLLWELLRNRHLGGFKFRRQHQYALYILDFFCAEASLAVELDGPIHELEVNRAFDCVRDEYWASQGVTVLRFSNREVLDETGHVLRKILSYLSV